jgi:protein-S-isoprenylcysteine O-methyltransferase Ste14
MADVSGDIRLAIFGVATLVLAYVSRASLFRPRSHGFYRFFVWAAILALILMNAPVWFRNPLSWHQVISWILLVVGLVPLGFGVHALRTRGKPDVSARQEPELLAFERTTKLVREGIFHFIRHPMYCSLLLLAWGVCLKAPSAAGGTLATFATAGLLRMAAIDEAECLSAFGPEYRQYMAQTKRFIPYVF